MLYIFLRSESFVCEEHVTKFIVVRESLIKQNALAVRRRICQCNILSETIRIVSLVAQDPSEVINLRKGGRWLLL